MHKNRKMDAPLTEAMAPAATTATRHRRRPALIALAVALLALSGLAGWWAFTQASDTTTVIGVKHTIRAGQVIKAEDLTQVQAAADPAIHTVPLTAADTVVGKRAATDLAAGTTLTPDSATDALVPHRGESLVGVLVAAGKAPVTGLAVGAPVRLVPSPQQQAGSLDTVSGVIVGVTETPDGTGQRVDVQVPAGQAAGIQRYASTNELSLVIDSKEG